VAHRARGVFSRAAQSRLCMRVMKEGSMVRKAGRPRVLALSTNGDRMSRCKHVVLFILLALVLGVGAKVGDVEAKVYIDVYGQSFKKVTIAAPPFSSDERQRPEISDLLGQDLDMSGFFVVAPRSMMDKDFLSEGVDKKSIRFDQWHSLGIDLLCKAVVKEKDNTFSLEAYLYDTGDGELIFGKRYGGVTPPEWRRVVHRLADDIIMAVTGGKGIMGSKVLFVAGSGRHKDVYVSDIDGYGARKLSGHNEIVVSPAASPDGRYLAFTSYKGGKPNLYVTEVGTNREVYVDREEGMKIGAVWMDRKTVAYSHTAGRFSTIYSVNVESKERKVLFRKDGILTSPAFSPDGSKMVFVSDMYGGPQIFSRDMATGEVKRLTYFGKYNTSPSFSPKGDFIAFVAKTDGGIEVCVMRPDGSDARVLTEGGINDCPRFSPCGRYILYSSQRGNGRTQVYMMLRNGDNKRPLKFTGGEESQPSFMP
jgi:TolB protein